MISFVLIFGVYLWFGLQPAEAAHTKDSLISIPSLGIKSDVTKADIADGELAVPATIAASYSRNKNKTLIYGHSVTVFKDLNHINIGDTITYSGETYYVTDIDILAKEDVNMYEILSREEKETIVLMTCDGVLYDNGDASHRLIVTASV